MWYDIFILAILVFAAYRGAQRGAIFQVAAIASVILCFVFAEAISAAIGPMVKLAPPLNNWVVMIVAYLVFSFASFGFARVLQRWVEKAGMTEFNKHVGGGFGLVKGIAFALVITFFAVTLSPKTRALLKDSRSGHLAANIMRAIHPVMPENFQRALDKYRYQLETDPELGGSQLAGDPQFGQPQLGQPSQPQRPGGVFGQFPDLVPGAGQPVSQPGGSGWNMSTPNIPTPQVSQQQPGSGLPQIAPPPGSGNWNPFSQPQSQQPQQPVAQPQRPAAQPVDPYSVEGILNSLPYVLSGDLENTVREGLANRTPEERAQMSEQLRNSDSSEIRRVMQQWAVGQGMQMVNDRFGTNFGRPTQPAYPNGGGYPSQQQPSYPNSGGFPAQPPQQQYGRPVPQPQQQPWTPASQPTSQQEQPSSGWNLGNLFGGSTQPVTQPQQPMQQPMSQQPVAQPSMQDQLMNAGRNYLGQQINQQVNQRFGTQPQATPPQTIPGLAELKERLRGTPSGVARAVIADYTADYLQTGLDPEPSTTVNTPLQQRYNMAQQRLSRERSQGAY